MLTTARQPRRRHAAAIRTFRANELVADRVMDSNELERERASPSWPKTRPSSLKAARSTLWTRPDTPILREVERALKMVDGVMLLVDAAEGPLPQTRYVLAKALEAHLKPIVVINKIDRPDARRRKFERDLRPLHRP